MEPTEIWTRTFDVVRRDLAVPTVWLAMQAAKPLTLDGNYFVAALPPPRRVSGGPPAGRPGVHGHRRSPADVTGRILAFRLINGETLADWEAQKAREAATAAPPKRPRPSSAPSRHAEPPPAFFRPRPVPPPPSRPRQRPPRQPPSSAPPSAPTRTVSPTWEKLNERLAQAYKNAPFIKYPHGQAQYVLTAVKMISDTMDVMMPPPGAPRDDAQERLLAKVIERLSGIANLDPLFLSLELLRYRELQGKNVDISL